MDPQPNSGGLPPDTQEIFDVQEDAKENSDEDISDLMADPEVVEADDESEDGDIGVVEGIIPPPVEDEEGVDCEEEPFSMDDFEEGFADGDNGQDDDEKPEESETEPASVPAHEVSGQPAPVEPGDEGEVAKFRRTLASLAAQAELDRLAFLREGLAKHGDTVPSLEEIAADVKGEKLLSPEGDCDLYARRPNTRLEGWKVGLAFGVPRRAKRFTKG